jgi:transposase-like protein
MATASKSNEPKTLREAIIYFADYDRCRQAIEMMRWPDGKVRCPRCGSASVAYLENVKRYKCYAKHPQAQFSLKVGTVFEDSPLGFEKWLPALWLLTNCKNGISSYELARALGVTQKSAWFMLSRLRLALQDNSTGGKLSGTVEADETFIGGKSRNMHYWRRKELMHSINKRGGKTGSRWGGPAGKTAVLGMLERQPNGKSRVRTMTVPNTRQNALQQHVRENVEQGFDHVHRFAALVSRPQG